MFRLMLALFALLWSSVMDASGDPPDDPAADDPPKPEGGGRYTDADVDRLKGEARKEARGAAERKFLETLGVDSLDDAKSALEAFREKQKAEQTEAERLQAELEEERKARQKAEETASARQEAHNQVLISSAVKEALLNAGARTDRIAAATRHADFTQASVDENGNVSGADKAAEAAKSEVPEFFADYAENKGGVPPSPKAKQRTGSKFSYNPNYSRPA